MRGPCVATGAVLASPTTWTACGLPSESADIMTVAPSTSSGSTASPVPPTNGISAAPKNGAPISTATSPSGASTGSMTPPAVSTRIARLSVNPRAIRVETAGGVIEPVLAPDGEVSVDMGAPQFRAADIPFVGGTGEAVEPLDVDGATVMISALSLGNPHAVQVVGDVSTAPVATQGPRIETHPRFPRRVNAGYMQVVDRANIRLRVWERGAGETLSCGTGACAAVVAGIRRGLIDSPVRVATRGGVLTIAWGGNARPVLMTGPAEAVFEGEWSVAER